MSLQPGFAGARILVVEDELIVAWALGDNLVDLGCSVVGQAANVQQAIALVGTLSIDAAILDLDLRGDRSYPVADALRARKVPFAFSTGYSRDSLDPAYADTPVLQKPFSSRDLRVVLLRLLAQPV